MFEPDSASPLRRLRGVARPCLTLLVAVLLVSAAVAPLVVSTGSAAAATNELTFTVEDNANEVEAIRTSDQSVAWTYSAGDTSKIEVSPDRSVVYVATYNTGLTALDASDGSVLWQSSLQNGETAAVSIAVASDGSAIYVGTAGDIQEFDSSGAYVGQVATTSSGVYSLAIDGEGASIYAGTFNGNLYKWDSAGTQQWSNSYAAAVDGLSIAPDGNSVYAGVDAASGPVVALDAADGVEQWSVSTSDGVNEVLAGPDGETVYFARSGSNDQLQALSTIDGSQQWVYTASGTVQDLSQSPGGATVYGAVASGELVALTASDGSVEYTVTGPYSNGLTQVASGGKFPYSPTTLSGTVTDRDGTALRGVSVAVTDSAGALVAEMTTNRNGGYAFNLATGDYTVTFNADGYQPVTRSASIDGDLSTVDVTLASAFAKTVTLDDPNKTFDEPRLVVFEYTASDIRQLEGGPYSQPDVWTLSDTYPLDGGSASADLVEGQQYAFRVVESGTGVSGGTRVVEEWPYYAQADGRAVTIDVPTTEGNETVTTTQTTDGTRVTYDGPPASEFSYELPSGFNETISWDDPREYYSTTVGGNATNATASDGGELSYSGSYANGTSFNGSSIYDSAALSFGPVGGSTGGGGGGASTTLAWGLVAAAGVAAYVRFGNGEVGRVVRRASDAARSLLS